MSRFNPSTSSTRPPYCPTCTRYSDVRDCAHWLCNLRSDPRHGEALTSITFWPDAINALLGGCSLVCPLRRWILAMRSGRSRWKLLLANSHLSGSIFLNPCITHRSTRSSIKTHKRALARAIDLVKAQGNMQGTYAVLYPVQSQPAWRKQQKGTRTHICIQLPYEGREIVVLEVLGQQELGEFRGIPDHKTAQAGCSAQMVAQSS